MKVRCPRWRTCAIVLGTSPITAYKKRLLKKLRRLPMGKMSLYNRGIDAGIEWAIQIIKKSR